MGLTVGTNLVDKIPGIGKAGVVLGGMMAFGKKAEKAAEAVEKTTRFLSGVKVIDKKTGRVFEGTVDLKPTLDRLKTGEKFPHKNDGAVFKNNQGRLPQKPEGYYSEYVHPTPGIDGPGPQRIVKGKGGELYYTPDHYGSFVPLNP